MRRDKGCDSSLLRCKVRETIAEIAMKLRGSRLIQVEARFENILRNFSSISLRCKHDMSN